MAGGGLSGLRAAHRLQESGFSVLVLEARDRVGGRVLSSPVRGDETRRVDLGAQWIGADHDRVRELADRAGLTRYSTHEEGKTLFHMSGETWALADGDLPGGESILEDYLRAVDELESMARTLPPEAPWEADDAPRWDRRTVRRWIDDNTSPGRARWLLETALRTILACELHEVSLLHLLFYVRSSGSLTYLMGTGGGAQDEQCLRGASGLVNWLADRLGDRVHRGRPVRRVVRHRRGVWYEGSDFRVGARFGVVALPPTLAGRIVYEPPLPAPRDGLTQRTPAGSVLKFHAIYNDPFWRRNGLSGTALSDRGPFRVVFDGGPPDTGSGFLVGFLEGDEARRAASLSPERRRGRILEELVALFGPEARNPRAYREHDWSRERYTRGCYGAFFPPGTWTAYGAYLRQPVGRIHWAGTETATAYAGYMEGALRAGDRVAKVIQRRFQR